MPPTLPEHEAASPEARAKHFSAVFQPHPAAAGGVREEIRDCLAGWEANPLAGDAMLLSTELITGALFDSNGVVRFDAVYDSGSLRLSVISAERSLASPTGGLPTPTRLGLVLIDQLADRWGIDEEAQGVRVWCELHGSDAEPRTLP